jgi:hypothetical protein
VLSLCTAEAAPDAVTRRIRQINVRDDAMQTWRYHDDSSLRRCLPLLLIAGMAGASPRGEARKRS